MLDATLSRIDNEIDQSLNRLFDFLKIKSISTDSKFKQDCDKAADWLVKDLNLLVLMLKNITLMGIQ